MTARALLVAALLLPLGACSEAPKPVEAKGPPAAFPAGEWEVTTLTQSLRSTDKTTPATSHKVGVSETRKVCSSGPKPVPALFADQGDDCTPDSDYTKDGRINMPLQCRRAGRGPLAVTLDGKYDATTFEVVAVTATSFGGSGDYALTQNIKGKRLGDCSANTTAGTGAAAKPAAG